MPKTRRKEACGFEIQKAAVRLGQNAEGRMLAVLKLRRKGACWGEKQKNWSLWCTYTGVVAELKTRSRACCVQTQTEEGSAGPETRRKGLA